ncbi:MAG: hypothetical protein KA792_08120 [Bacteroidales bacterium]|nr:hypothetical protein [Bacteroidales bacterium]
MELFKYLEIILISSVKFVAGAPISFIQGLNFAETLILTSVGGLGGVLFFYYFSKLIPKSLSKYFIKKENVDNKSVKGFKNKILYFIQNKYGLTGIVVLTPVLLSIPLGTILAKKYYTNSYKVAFYLSSSVFAWAIIVSSLVHIW